MIKTALNNILISLGYKMSRLSDDEYGLNLEFDIAKLFQHIEKKGTPIVFDVGANIGQSVKKFKKHSSNAIVHTFEPSPETFSTLCKETNQYNNLFHNNFGLGAELKKEQFYENTLDDISSFLEPTELLWGKTKKVNVVEVKTLDGYCEQAGIEKVNYLKIDTQGYDLEVLKGAKEMLQNRTIDVIQMEITIEELYHQMPRMDDVLKFLFDNDYHLVAFYGFHNNDIKARWTDAIFISSDFKNKA